MLSCLYLCHTVGVVEWLKCFKLGFIGRSPTRPRRGHIESRRDISSAARHISSPEGTYRLRVFVDIHPSGVRYASGIGLRLDIPLSRLDMRLWRKNSPTNPNLNIFHPIFQTIKSFIKILQIQKSPSNPTFPQGRHPSYGKNIEWVLIFSALYVIIS